MKMKVSVFFALPFLLIMLTMQGCLDAKKSKVNPYSYKAPEEIQKHFNHKIKWDAIHQERWKNGFLWVDSTGGDKIIIMRRDRLFTNHNAKK